MHGFVCVCVLGEVCIDGWMMCMCMCLCMCVGRSVYRWMDDVKCVPVFVLLCGCVRVCVCVSVCMFVCWCVCTCVCMSTCVCVYNYISTETEGMMRQIW